MSCGDAGIRTRVGWQNTVSGPLASVACFRQAAVPGSKKQPASTRHAMFARGSRALCGAGHGPQSSPEAGRVLPICRQASSLMRVAAGTGCVAPTWRRIMPSSVMERQSPPLEVRSYLDIEILAFLSASSIDFAPSASSARARLCSTSGIRFP